jgi:hypothetical protein
VPLARPVIPPPDWDQERAEAAEAQRQLDAERRRLRGEIGPESLTPPVIEDTETIPKRKVS